MNILIEHIEFNHLKEAKSERAPSKKMVNFSFTPTVIKVVNYFLMFKIFFWMFPLISRKFVEGNSPPPNPLEPKLSWQV